MQKYYYDMHIHSCLSPCGDDDMTPLNIAGMAALKSLNILALCDHNSVKNCPAFFAACRPHGIIPVAGMELTTAEDIHLICLFKTLKSALEFGRTVETKRVLIKNRPHIFGNQYVMDENDRVVAVEENLLPNATGLSLEEGAALCEKHGGLCYPAHIDRQANGIVSTLGTFPEKPFFPCAELSDKTNLAAYKNKYPILREKKIIASSDAHHLWDINEAENYFMLEGEPCGEKSDTEALFDFLEEDRRM